MSAWVQVPPTPMRHASACLTHNLIQVPARYREAGSVVRSETVSGFTVRAEKAGKTAAIARRGGIQPPRLRALSWHGACLNQGAGRPDEALKVMTEHKVRRVPVLDDEQNLVGIVSQGDIAIHLGDKDTGRLVESISAGG